MAIELLTHPLYGDANLVSYWRFEGNSNDTKGLNNGVDTNITYSIANGYFGQGAGIPTNGKIALADSASLSLTGAYTINALINTSAPGAQKGIFEKYDFGDINGYLLRLSAAQKLVGFNFLAASYVSITGGTTIPTNTWTMVSLTYDGTNLRLHVNGVLDASPVASGAPTNGSRAARIGNEGADSGPLGLDGKMDELFILSRAMSTAELLSYWNFLIGGGSPVFFDNTAIA